MGGADELGVLGQYASSMAGLGSAPLRQPGFDFFRRQFKADLPFLAVDRDRVAVADDRNGSADIGFRRDVSDDETMAPARESSIRDKRDVFTQTFAHNG